MTINLVTYTDAELALGTSLGTVLTNIDLNVPGAAIFIDHLANLIANPAIRAEVDEVTRYNLHAILGPVMNNEGNPVASLAKELFQFLSNGRELIDNHVINPQAILNQNSQNICNIILRKAANFLNIRDTIENVNFPDVTYAFPEANGKANLLGIFDIVFAEEMRVRAAAQHLVNDVLAAQGVQEAPADDEEPAVIGAQQAPADDEEPAVIGAQQAPADDEEPAVIGAQQAPVDDEEPAVIGAQQAPVDDEEPAVIGAQQAPVDDEEPAVMGAQQAPDDDEEPAVMGAQQAPAAPEDEAAREARIQAARLEAEEARAAAVAAERELAARRAEEARQAHAARVAESVNYLRKMNL